MVSPIEPISFVPPSYLPTYGTVAHDGGYASNLASLATQGLLEKVMLLKGYSDMAFDIRRFNLPVLSVGHQLFLSRRLETYPSQPLLPLQIVSPAPINKQSISRTSRRDTDPYSHIYRAESRTDYEAQFDETSSQAPTNDDWESIASSNEEVGELQLGLEHLS